MNFIEDMLMPLRVSIFYRLLQDDFDRAFALINPLLAVMKTLRPIFRKLSDNRLHALKSVGVRFFNKFEQIFRKNHFRGTFAFKHVF